MFSRESLEELRQKIDLIEVLNPYVHLQKAGASYKGLCPFHEEKSPSFVVQKGDSHFHCYGCGEHGDAIAFLMNHVKMTFSEAVENLAERFCVRLQTTEKEYKGPSKSLLKDVMEKASRFYQFALLHTEDGQRALSYLYSRGIDLSFVQMFRLGYAPKGLALRSVLHDQKISDVLMEEVGLIRENKRDFFYDRIMIPITDPLGSVIGFSARSFGLQEHGPKYINTKETYLFKKSKILFGLSYCRKKIAKERKAIIVEGQLDALRLIHEGFALAVASQGTAFGDGHVRELMQLGVNHIYIGFDGDGAGKEAAIKVGDLFQKEGIEVSIINLPEGKDPDTVLREEGPEKWNNYMEKSQDYLSFLIDKMTEGVDMNSPAHKSEVVQALVKRIRSWDHPLMVHESLRKLARLTRTPESIVGVGETAAEPIEIRKFASVSHTEVNPDRILETDLLRWLILMGETIQELVELAKQYVKPEHFRVTICRHLFEKYLAACKENRSRDLLSLAIDLDDAEQQILLSDILQKRINRERAKECFIETVQKILDRHWMLRREEIKVKIYSGKHSEEEVLALAKEFDAIKKQRPKIEAPDFV